jgi:hypothetical protein
MSQLMLVRSARFLVPLPEELDPVAAAPLTDAGLTPYHAVRRSWSNPAPGATAARIIAVGLRQDVLDVARESGADPTLRSGEPAMAAIRGRDRWRGRRHRRDRRRDVHFLVQLRPVRGVAAVDVLGHPPRGDDVPAGAGDGAAYRLMEAVK